ncbi:hypothetical protein ABZ470_18405 [Streptosporangium sp. NPDC020072]|uniref:hypothetical protein n=1 Tax=Streptosporangium sp. NPDC020072 TaxID=3154788 RepID=UPI0034405E1C
MSFDLGVWAIPQSISDAQAMRIYEELCEENAASVRDDPGVQRFAQALLEQFPALEDLADEQIEASPWSVSPWVTGSHVIISTVWSRSSEVTQFVLGLTGQYGLVCFDPQNAVVVYHPSTPA